MPFFEKHLVLAHSPFEATPPQVPGGRGSYDVPRNLPLRDVAGVERHVAQTRRIAAALPYITGLKNLTLTGEQILPALGIEGALAAGWSAAKVACALAGKKKDYLRDEVVGAAELITSRRGRPSASAVGRRRRRRGSPADRPERRRAARRRRAASAPPRTRALRRARSRGSASSWRREDRAADRRRRSARRWLASGSRSAHDRRTARAARPSPGAPTSVPVAGGSSSSARRIGGRETHARVRVDRDAALGELRRGRALRPSSTEHARDVDRRGAALRREVCAVEQRRAPASSSRRNARGATQRARSMAAIDTRAPSRDARATRQTSR